MEWHREKTWPFPSHDLLSGVEDTPGISFKRLYSNVLEEKVNQKSLEYVEGDEVQPEKLKSCSYRSHVWAKSWSSLCEDPAAKDEKCFCKIVRKIWWLCGCRKLSTISLNKGYYGHQLIIHCSQPQMCPCWEFRKEKTRILALVS